MKRRLTLGVGAVVSFALPAACHREPAPAPKPRASAAAGIPASASAGSALASTGPAPNTGAPAPPPASTEAASERLIALVERWNRATNEGHGKVLAELYADKVGLYGRVLAREEAVARKLEALRRTPGFTQTYSQLSWTPRVNADMEASFAKASGPPGQIRTVRAYLLLHHDGTAWHVIDEGDARSPRRAAGANKQQSFHCACDQPFASDPEVREEPPPALPPLGPAEVSSAVEPPPGAPKLIEYASLYEERFSMSNDVPLFVTVTNLSTNGDGRWFFYELPGDAGAKRRVLDCAHGGFWYSGKAPGTPDPGYPKAAGMKSTVALTRDKEGIHYEKVLYAPDGIESHLSCTLDPEYEAYFMPIVRRAGDTLRGEPGGQYGRNPFAKQAQPASER